MSEVLALLKYVVVGTLLTATFIILSLLIYLHILYHGLNTEIMTSLLSGHWPDPPVERVEKAPMTLPDSLAQGFARLASKRTALRTLRVSLERRAQEIDDKERKLETESRRLSTLKAQIDSLQAAQERHREDRLAQVIKLVESMKPAQSVPILQNLTDDMVVDMLLKMKERRAADILSSLSPGRAARLAKIMGMIN